MKILPDNMLPSSVYVICAVCKNLFVQSGLAQMTDVILQRPTKCEACIVRGAIE